MFGSHSEEGHLVSWDETGIDCVQATVKIKSRLQVTYAFIRHKGTEVHVILSTTTTTTTTTTPENGRLPVDFQSETLLDKT